MVQSRSRFKNVKGACINIQSIVRSFIAQKTFRRIVRKIVTLQSFARQCSVKRMIRNHHVAAIGIQSMYRQYAASSCYKTTKLAILKIQSMFRSRAQVKRYNNMLAAIFDERINSAATRIQTLVRMVQSRRHFKHFLSATVVLQSFGRLILMQKTLRRETNAATIIESNVRRYQVQVNFMKLKHCATRIQAHYRMHMSAKMFKKTRRASIKIQSFHRCSSAWRRRVAIKKACKVVEKHYNNLLLRREKMLKEAAVLKIQAIIRGNQARRCAERMMKFKSLQKLEAIRIKYAAMTIQQAFRQFRRSHYVRVLQRFARICGAKSFAITKRKSVVTMQSFFRAVLVRKDMPRRIKEARKRVEEAAKLAAEADRLGNRTAVALNVLLNSTNLSGVKRAIVTLEVSTRLSDICAFKFVEMGAVPIIYKLIRSCNRSEPHRAVLAYALNVLRHTSCYEKANTSEYLPPRKHRIETLLELMQTFREQPEVLRQITHLMFHLCKDRSFAKQLSLDRDVMKRLLSILRLLQRKVKHSTGVNKKKRSLEMRGVRNLERLIERINTGR